MSDMEKPSLHPVAGVPHFRALDGMRGALAFGVVMFHFGFNTMAQGAFGWLGMNFRVCVDIFFLLSGFVLTYSMRKGSPLGIFVVKRMFRLVPVYYVTILFIWIVLKTPIPLLDWLLLTRFFGDMPVNGPAWSICLELFLPILAVAVSFRIPDRLVWPSLIVVLLGLGWADMPLPQEDANHVLRGVLGLLGGHLLYRTGADWRWPFMPILGLMLGLMAAAMYLPWAALALPFVASVAIVCGRHDQGLMVTAPFQWLGTISYSIYLVHKPLLDMIVGLNVADRHDAVLKIAGIAASIVVAILVTYLIEKPGMRLGAKVVEQIRRGSTRRESPAG